MPPSRDCVEAAQRNVPYNGRMSRVYRLTPEALETIIEKLSQEVARRPEVSFAYAFGSALTAEGFRDIDVGIWTRDGADEFVDLDLAGQLSRSVGFSIDVRRINNAPVPFLFQVLRGRLLHTRDELLLSDLIERTAREYHDRAPLLRRAAREAFAA